MKSIQKLPPKIKNLYWLREQGFNVPCFFVLDEFFIKDIENQINKLYSFFKKNNPASIIIRSASFNEDLGDKSRAGFFESSSEIELQKLDQQIILDLWNKNSQKIPKNKQSGLYLFIQEYSRVDFSGVFFTQHPFNENLALLTLSSSAHAITDNLTAERLIKIDKKNSSWENEEEFNQKIKNQIQDIIKIAEKKFPQGADIELGIKRDDIHLHQIRPITRNNDQKTLLQEKNRLKKIFKNSFKDQEWVKNNFTEALGDLSNTSLLFYNKLFNSDYLKNFLKEFGFIDKVLQKNNFRLLENIGSRTFFNITQEKISFPKKETWWSNFKRMVNILSSEKLAEKESEKKLKEVLIVEEIFSWFFISGIYFQIFLEKEKNKLNFDDYLKKLKNTELYCEADEPRPKSLEIKDLKRFKKNFFFLSSINNYELLSKKYKELPLNEIKDIYSSVNFSQKKSYQKNFLNKDVVFWLKQKVLWREKFLKNIYENKDLYLNLNKKEIINNSNISLSNSFTNISGKNYPFPKIKGQKKVQIIVPGEIKLNEINKLNEGDNIQDFFGKYIAISFFPNQWIPYISKFKGIILREGNELSHTSITCREYNIPCKIIPSFFSKK